MSDTFTATISTISLVFSCVSTVIAGLTAFYALLRRPRAKMTRPTFVAFTHEGAERLPKVITRALLYSTAAPGLAVEAMFARVKQDGQSTAYTFWGYGDSQLVAGGGLYVGLQGVVMNHHLVLPPGGKRLIFRAGPLTVDLCARIAGERGERVLQHIELTMTAPQAEVLNKGTEVVGFDFRPETDDYHGQIRNRT